MRLGMMLSCFFRVMLGLNMVAVRHMSVMTGLLMIARFVVLRGRAMMLRRMLMMFCCPTVVFRNFF